jgi:hypothetical protein
MTRRLILDAAAILIALPCLVLALALILPN